MKIRSSFAFLLSLIALNAFAGQDRGGGDINSSRIRDVVKLFEENNYLTNSLIEIATTVANFKRPDGEISAQIQDLVARGILEDFKHAKYDLQPKCVDDKNIERSATTLKVNLSFDPNPERPIICINVRKLAMENAKRDDIVGLLFHEHARHFGFEDSDKYGIHPIAEWVTAKGVYLYSNYAVNGFVNKVKHESFNEFYTVRDSEEFILVIDKLKGTCDGTTIKTYNLLDYLFVKDWELFTRFDDNKHLPFHSDSSRPAVNDIPTLGLVSEGATFAIPYSESLSKRPVFVFMPSQNPMTGIKYPYFGPRKITNYVIEKCEITYHFESNGEKSEQMSTSMEKTYYSENVNYPFLSFRLFDSLKDLN